MLKIMQHHQLLSIRFSTLCTFLYLAFFSYTQVRIYVTSLNETAARWRKQGTPTNDKLRNQIACKTFQRDQCGRQGYWKRAVKGWHRWMDMIIMLYLLTHQKNYCDDERAIQCSPCSTRSNFNCSHSSITSLYSTLYRITTFLSAKICQLTHWMYVVHLTVPFIFSLFSIYSLWHSVKFDENPLTYISSNAIHSRICANFRLNLGRRTVPILTFHWA